MGKKKESPEEKAESLAKSIRDGVERWNTVKAKGTRDPFYPDGVNLNLIRTGIIAHKMQLKELCKSLKKCPKEARVKIPKAVPEDYMAPKSKAAKHALPPIKSKK